AGGTVFNFNQRAVAVSGARSDLGSLGAHSRSEASSSPQNYLYTSGGVGASTENLYTAKASSGATAYWYDRITVGGTPGPNGRVVLRFTIELDGTTFATPGAHSGIHARLFIDERPRYIGDVIVSLDAAGEAS